ncbi:MAG TPA: ABC transporter ATP-binding protein [Lachnospiraceae bacterium]|nr:ABC transporter ATP-binding protein [Lachnospiraceae bacterium]
MKIFKRKISDEEKKKAENPYYYRYGDWSNTIYILSKIKQYCPVLLLLMAIGMVTQSLIRYLWSVISKIVIDMIQQQAGNQTKDIKPLLLIMAVVLLVEVAAFVGNAVTDNKRNFLYIKTRMNMITERVDKTLAMYYEKLEQPKALDMEQRAEEATNGNNQGVEGLMRMMYEMGVNAFVMVITMATISVMDMRLLLTIAFINGLQYLYFKYIVQVDKVEVWDLLAPTWRKINYMQRATQDFDFAKDIRLFHMQGYLSGKQNGILKAKEKRMYHHTSLWARYMIFSNALVMVSTFAIYAFMIYHVLKLDMSIGNFTLFLGMAQTFSAALTQLLNSLAGYRRASLQVDDFRSFIGMNMNSTGDLPVPKADSYVFDFQDVSFKYQGADNDALKHLNLKLEAGERLAVVGLNGAGKTTFIKLLLRLYDVSEGRILLNGVDIRNYDRDSYYELFAPVFQNVELFAFPMAENVSMKRPDETDKEKSRVCLEMAGMTEKLKSLSEGVDTQLLKILYDEGIDLSGGEKQKLALARALYKDAPIVVLDEPTAALDALAEYELYCNFDTMIGNKSAVYISHRLSSTRFCDHIAMFVNGELVEYGTHNSLLAKGGAYSEMFALQAQYYQEEEEHEA